MSQYDQKAVPEFDVKLWDVKAFIRTAEGKSFELKLSRELINKILISKP